MLKQTSETGTLSPNGNPAGCPPQQASTWFLNWMNFNVVGGPQQPPLTEFDALYMAKSINPVVTSWLTAQNSSPTKTSWWPRVGVVISDFSDLIDGTLVSRIVSMNGAKYQSYNTANAIPDC